MIEKDQNTITGRQLAAARVLLGLFQSEVASWANISESTLKRFEAEKKPIAMSNNFLAVKRVLEEKGVEFTEGGVRLGWGARFEKAFGSLAKDS
jgi:DNA-binding transcriptional regulator YiaG